MSGGGSGSGGGKISGTGRPNRPPREKSPCRVSSTGKIASTLRVWIWRTNTAWRQLSSTLLNSALQKWQAKPILEQSVDAGEMQPVVNPAEPKDVVGFVREATEVR